MSDIFDVILSAKAWKDLKKALKPIAVKLQT